MRDFCCGERLQIVDGDDRAESGWARRATEFADAMLEAALAAE